jgi:UDP:flavonoid glycosyltransferase YjiC (YdhE family)
MSRILFAWELGGGYGHLGPFRPIAQALMARGHQVTVAARDVEPANIVFGSTAAGVIQAPLCTKTYNGLAEPPLNFAEILMRYGYLDRPLLDGLVRAWRDLIRMAEPNVLICDHAPTALLAARGMPCAKIVTGSPFTIPPRSSPTPNLRPWVDVPLERLVNSDAAVLATANASLPDGMARLDTVAEIFDGAELLLNGVPELDPFAPRETATYLGLHAGLIGKEVPRWPDGDGPRVFAYLRSDYKHIEATLAALTVSGARCVIFVHGATPALREKHKSGRLVFSAGLLDMDRAVTESDLCVCHGNFGTVMEVLRRGKPMVVLPLDLEKFLTATAVERQNAGCWIHPDTANPDFNGAIRRVLTDSAFKDSARAFASKHGEPPVGTIVQGAADRIESLAQTGSKGE